MTSKVESNPATEKIISHTGNSSRKISLIVLATGLSVLFLFNIIYVAVPLYRSGLTPIEFESSKIQSSSAFTPIAGWWVDMSQNSSGSEAAAIRGQGAESLVDVVLPQSTSYRLSLELTRLPTGGNTDQIEVFLNDVLLGTLELQTIGEKQRFDLAAPASATREGVNHLRFAYPGLVTDGQEPNNFLFHSIVLQRLPAIGFVVGIVGQTILWVIGQVGLLAIIVLAWRFRTKIGGKAKNLFDNPKELVGRVILLAFGIIFALIMAEIGLRIVLPSESGSISGDLNPWMQYVGWGGNPHQTRINTKFKTVIQYNSKGLRDVEYPYEKPLKTFRILIIGDSFVEAEQINDLNDTFPRILEKLLNQRQNKSGVQFQVVAAGFSGWGTDQHLLYYQYEGYKYEPDLVLSIFTSNDVADSYIPWRVKETGWPDGCIYKPFFELENQGLALKNFPYHSQTVRATDEQDAKKTLGYFAWFKSYMYEHIRIYRLIVDAVWDNSPRANEVLTTIGFMPVKVDEIPGRCQQTFKPQGDHKVNLYVYQVHYSNDAEQAWALVNALITELKHLTMQHDTKLAIIANPSSTATAAFRDNRVLYTDSEGVEWDWGKVDRILADIAKKEEIPFLALQPAFDQSPYKFEDLFILNDGHYNVGGHRLAAETIFAWLVEQALVPK